MIRAQTHNIIDYSKYRRYDIKWGLREGLLIGEMLSDLSIESSKIVLQTYTAALNASEPGTEGSNKYHSSVFETYHVLMDLLRPWAAIGSKQKKAADEQWKEFEETTKTEEFKQLELKQAKILAELSGKSNFATDRKLAELMDKSATSKKIINRKKF